VRRRRLTHPGWRP